MEPAPHDPSVATAVPDPTTGQQAPWPVAVVVGLAAAGLISPLIPFAGAVAAYALADKDQGTILTGACLGHIVIGLTLAAGG